MNATGDSGASVTKWSVRISKPAAELEPKLDHAVKLADTGSAKLSKAVDLIPGLIG